MAGSGSRLRQGYGGQTRLRGAGETFLKPFIPVLGRPLISYVVDAVVRAGIKNAKFVVGYENEHAIAQIKKLIPPGLEACFIENPEWKKQNGISLLVVANHVDAPFLLTMGDHLFDNAIVDLLIKSADPGFLNVAVDRKLDSIFDLDDAMKLQTNGNQIVAIGKNLRDYDAVDAGLFVCPCEIFEYLERAKSGSGGSDCSLADGVRLMAADNKVRTVEIGSAWWQDVDTPAMLRGAEEHLRGRDAGDFSATTIQPCKTCDH